MDFIVIIAIAVAIKAQLGNSLPTLLAQKNALALALGLIR